MADLVTRILAEDKQFNDKIERSKKTVKGFSEYNKKAGSTVDSLGGKMTSLATGSLAKMLGAVGAAAVSYKTLTTAIESTDKTGDAFASTIEQARSATDKLMTSIATANFSNFWQGMGESIRLAREYYSALDDLEDRRMGYGMRSGEINAAIQENRAVLSDPYATTGEKSAALAILKEEEAKLVELTEIIRDKSRATAEAMIANAANASFPRAEIERFKDYLAGTETGLYELEAERSRLQKEYKQGQGSWVQTSSFTPSKYIEQTESSKAAESALKSLEEKNKADLEFLDKINRLNTTERETWAKLEQEYTGYSTQLSAVTRTINREARRLEGEKGREAAKVDILPTGSLAELEKKIQEARKSFMNATTDDARAAADALVKDLEAKKAILEIQFKYTGIEDVKPGDKLAKATNALPDFSDVDMSGVVYAPDVKIFDSWGDRISHVANKNRDLIDTVYGVSDAVAGMGNILGENGGQWAQWGANVLSAIGQGLPAIMALTEAKKAEATANTASAASGAASSVAGIPVVGPIMAVAAVASILGALANLPKFAYGGIVGGSSFSGDNMLARVNSGEMILNSAQQNRLFQIANGGGSSGGTKKIELVLSGKTARAVIDADNKWWDRI